MPSSQVPMPGPVVRRAGAIGVGSTAARAVACWWGGRDAAARALRGQGACPSASAWAAASLASGTGDTGPGTGLPRSAATISAPDIYRCSGNFSIARRITASTAARYPGVVACRRRRRVAYMLHRHADRRIAQNGSRPSASRSSTTPVLYRSLAGVSGEPVACSGEMYPAVPSAVPASVISISLTPLAMPKSTTFAVPRASIRMLCGLTSRWMIPAAVRVIERRRHLRDHLGRLGVGELAALADQCGEVGAVNQFLNDVPGVAVAADIIDIDDIRDARGRRRTAPRGGSGRGTGH